MTIKHTITTPLDYNTQYKWKVRYKGTNYDWSEWSDETVFTTLNAYTVSVSGGTGVSVTPTSQIVNPGYSTTFTLTFDSGYQLNSVSHGSVSGNTWTIPNVTENITATVSAKLPVDYYTSPNFTRSTNFIQAPGEDIIKVNNSLGVAPNDQPGTYHWNSNDIYNTGNCKTIGPGWYCPNSDQLKNILYPNKDSINAVADANFKNNYYLSNYLVPGYNLVAMWHFYYNQGAACQQSSYQIVRCVKGF